VSQSGTARFIFRAERLFEFRRRRAGAGAPATLLPPTPTRALIHIIDIRPLPKTPPTQKALHRARLCRAVTRCRIATPNYPPRAHSGTTISQARDERLDLHDRLQYLANSCGPDTPRQNGARRSSERQPGYPPIGNTAASVRAAARYAAARASVPPGRHGLAAGAGVPKRTAAGCAVSRDAERSHAGLPASQQH